MEQPFEDRAHVSVISVDFIEDDHLARQTEQPHEPVFGLQDARQAFRFENRDFSLLHLRHLRQKRIAMNELEVQLPFMAALAQVALQHPFEHRIACRLCGHGDIHATGKTPAHRKIRRV